MYNKNKDGWNLIKFEKERKPFGFFMIDTFITPCLFKFGYSEFVGNNHCRRCDYFVSIDNNMVVCSNV